MALTLAISVPPALQAMLSILEVAVEYSICVTQLAFVNRTPFLIRLVEGMPSSIQMSIV